MNQVNDLLSARRYTDFAEGGRGRPGLLRSQSATQSLRVRGPAMVEVDDATVSEGCCWLLRTPNPENPREDWPSDVSAAGVAGTDDPPCADDPDEAARKVEERGANTIMSV